MLTQSVAGYALPPPVLKLGDATGFEGASVAVRLARLADLAAALARVRASLKEQNDRFDELYREAEHASTTLEELEETSRIILEMENQAANAIRPQIEQLEQNIARKHPPSDFARSLRRSAEEALDISIAWIELYQNLRIRLLKLASDRRTDAGETGSAIMSDAGEMERYLRQLVRE